MKKNPNFLYVGAPKCGSTWLYDALIEHPEVHVHPGKYIHYFKDFYFKGIEWYLSHYEGVESQRKAVGDFATDYMFYEDVIQRVHNDFPNMKLIVCLRSPVERDWSAYKFLLSTGEVSGDLPSAISTGPDFLSLCSAYGTGLENILRYFPGNQVLVTFYEELRSDPSAYFKKVCNFLEVDSSFVPSNINRRSYKTKVARYPQVNGVLKRGSWFIRKLGFGSLAMRLKRSKFAKTFMFKEGESVRFTSKEYEILLDKNLSEIEKAENLLGVKLSHWKKES